jgi:plastocyanin
VVLPTSPPGKQSKYSSLSVAASETTLFTRPPGNTTIVSARPVDQDGRQMSGLGTPTFSSDNEAVATVDADGLVTAQSPGSISIRATLTATGVTRTGSAGIFVIEGDMEATFTAPFFAFIPELVDIARGGTVTWTNAGVAHNVIFTTDGAPDAIPDLWVAESRSRQFPDSGSFHFVCTQHPGMSGVVYYRCSVRRRTAPHGGGLQSG